MRLPSLGLLSGLVLVAGITSACGGVPSTPPATAAAEPAPSAESAAAETLDVSSLADCDTVITAYKGLMDDSAACQQDSDCRVEAGNCDTGLGGCWYAVATDFDTELKGRLVERHRELACGGGVCRCPAPPEAARCEAGRCVAP
ncbi:MAG: hypothetical protein AAF604_13655 [Acidobacteriota bacterium]